MKSLLIFSAIVLCVSADLFSDLGNYDRCTVLNEKKMTLMWTIDGNTIKFAVAGKTTGYVAIGFNQNGEAAMVNSDAIIGWVDGEGTTITDIWMSSQNECSGSNGVCADTAAGGSNDVTVVSGDEDADNKITRVRFTRSLNTGDDYDTIIEDKNMWVVYAMATSDAIVQHNQGNNYVQLNFFTDPQCPVCAENETCVKGCCATMIPADGGDGGDDSSASTLVGSVALATVAAVTLL